MNGLESNFNFPHTVIITKDFGGMIVNQTKYSIIKEEFVTDAGSPYTSFGIACAVGNAEVLRISDISLNRNAVEVLASAFNCFGLPPERIKNTVLQFLP